MKLKCVEEKLQDVWRLNKADILAYKFRWSNRLWCYTFQDDLSYVKMSWLHGRVQAHFNGSYTLQKVISNYFAVMSS